MANSNDNVRTTQISLYVEDVIAEAFSAISRKDGVTMSAYGRRLVLEELMRRELLPNETILRLLAGPSA